MWSYDPLAHCSSNWRVHLDTDFGVLQDSHLNQGSEGRWAAHPNLAAGERPSSQPWVKAENLSFSESHKKQRLLQLRALQG